MSQFSIHDSREFADAADAYAATLDIAIARDGLKRAFAEGVAHALRLSVGDIRTGDDETLAAIAKLYQGNKAPSILHGTIEFTGKTTGDVEQALTEALTRIKAGNTSGFDRNSDASFTFTVDGEENAFSDEDA